MFRRIAMVDFEELTIREAERLDRALDFYINLDLEADDSQKRLERINKVWDCCLGRRRRSNCLDNYLLKFFIKNNISLEKVTGYITRMVNEEKETPLGPFSSDDSDEDSQSDDLTGADHVPSEYLSGQIELVEKHYGCKIDLSYDRRASFISNNQLEQW